MSQHPEIIVICGPTASGKSGIALSVAQKTGGVIINADSQQVYKELRVITARPSEAEEKLAEHKLYGFMSVTESCSAGKWLKFARMEIDWARAMKRTAIVVGGTGMYIKALMQGIAEIPDIDPAVRAQAMSDFDAMGKESFSERLRAVDPAFFERLTVFDPQRLVRAYAVWLGSGKSLSWWQGQGSVAPYPQESFVLLQVEMARDELYRRCDERFELMLEQGALEEVGALLATGLEADAPSLKSVGIKELGAYLAGEMTLEAAVGAAQQATRNYAKRQVTWFKNQWKDTPFTPVTLDSGNSVDIEAKMAKLLNNN